MRFNDGSWQLWSMWPPVAGCLVAQIGSRRWAGSARAAVGDGRAVSGWQRHRRERARGLATGVPLGVSPWSVVLDPGDGWSTVKAACLVVRWCRGVVPAWTVGATVRPTRPAGPGGLRRSAARCWRRGWGGLRQAGVLGCRPRYAARPTGQGVAGPGWFGWVHRTTDRPTASQPAPRGLTRCRSGRRRR